MFIRFSIKPTMFGEMKTSLPKKIIGLYMDIMIIRKIYIATVVTVLLIILLLSCAENCFGESTSAWEKMLDAAGVSELHKVNNPNANMYIVKVEKSDLTLTSDVESFDVSDNRIAIAFADQTLGIFDDNMKLIKSYKCKSAGTTCGVIFKNENLLLFYDRCDYVTEISQSGEFVALYDAPRDIRITDYAYMNTCVSDKYLYYVSNDKDIPEAKSRWVNEPYLIRQTNDGKKEILYDSYDHHRKRTLAFIVCPAIFFLLILLLLFHFNRKREKGELDPYWTEMHMQQTKKTVKMIQVTDNTFDNPLISSSNLNFEDNTENMSVHSSKESAPSNPLEKSQ